MDPVANTLSRTVGSEPIPGYVLEEIVGTGGYGEVWRVAAPGGLKKAIKFVHGRIDSSQATRELRSLERIKSVRHPFLLTLERLEVTQDQLMIVTELAQSNLRERFMECLADGHCGIPRDELLGYMAETADALDYLAEQESLQHLDIKPENLLLIGSHVKVADFSLIKDLHDENASLVTGLTPKYSSPELFDGSPGRASDQYSLAVTYHELLTGQLPFDGTSAAQLASQHVNSPANLSALPVTDRTAVGKALNKRPAERFASCREFVEYVRNPPSSTASVLIRATPALSPTPDPSDTASVNDGRTLVLTSDQAVQLPALPSPDPTTPFFRPAVIVGVGGHGALVLQRLKQRLLDRFGSLDDLASLRLLLIDTDIRTVESAASPTVAGSLSDDESLVLPLRKSTNYRTAQIDQLKSISRRWIYNIPRSQQTSGLRALGRLAMLDHCGRLLEKMRSIVQSVCDRENIQRAARQLDLEFVDSTPRVFVVGSVSGGTSSGMTLDIGYAIRQVMADLCISDHLLASILIHSLPRAAKAKAMAAANAYAFLHELAFFGRPDTVYPGEPTVGLAGFKESRWAFTSNYLVDWGEALDTRRLHQEADNVAEFLYLNTATSASAFFDVARSADEESPVRSFGICQLSDSDSELPSAFSEFLCKTIVRQWRGGIDLHLEDRPRKLSELGGSGHGESNRPAFADQVEQMAATEMQRLGLTAPQLEESCRGIARQELRADEQSYFRNVIERRLAEFQELPEASNTPLLDTIRAIDELLGIAEPTSLDRAKFECLRDALHRQLVQQNSDKGTQLALWIGCLVRESTARVDAAQFAAGWIATSLKQLESDVHQNRNRIHEEAEQLKLLLRDVPQTVSLLRKNRKKNVDEIVMLLLKYVDLRFREVLLAEVCRTLSSVESHVMLSADGLRDLWGELNQLAKEFHTTVDECGQLPTSCQPESNSLWMKLREIQPELLQQLNDAVGDNLSDGSLSQPRAVMVEQLRRTARAIVVKAVQGLRRSELSVRLQTSPQPSPHLGQDWLQESLEKAEPAIHSCGGASRLIVTGTSSETEGLKEGLQRYTDQEASVVSDPDLDAVICVEIASLDHGAVGSHLIQNRPDFAELARRLHTRIDVPFHST